MIKIIGKFSEDNDGKEFTDFKDVKEELGLIGSLSGDVGNIELFYDDHGNTYAIAFDSETYYGTGYVGEENTDFTELMQLFLSNKMRYGNPNNILIKGIDLDENNHIDVVITSVALNKQYLANISFHKWTQGIIETYSVIWSDDKTFKMTNKEGLPIRKSEYEYIMSMLHKADITINCEVRLSVKKSNFNYEPGKLKNEEGTK